MKELKISKAELARMVGVSRSYITNMANESAPTRTGQYEPGPDVVAALARSLQIEESEILRSMDYIQNGHRPKPQNAAEFAERLADIGFEIQTDFDFERLGPDDLQDVIDMIEANLLGKAKRLKREEQR
jgi:transcriptional regulator with XRE-family HTH domain